MTTRVAGNPQLAVGELRKYGIKANRVIHSLYNEGGVDVVSEDWDNLLILDGYRYDMYVDRKTLHRGAVERRTSRASTSKTFIDQNFNGRELHDTVYVTANPFVKELDEGTFHAVYDLFGQWDDDFQTVPPDAVAEKARQVDHWHPDKRLIVHFMQPHYPFIGELGQSLTHRGFYIDGDSEHQPSVWAVLQYGYEGFEDVSRERVWDAYCENLEVVLNQVEDLLDDLVDRTVITADHGNLVGECLRPIPVRAYGHPHGLRSPELVEVPWHVIEDDSRKQIVAESPRESSTVNEGDVTEQLKALGYR